MIDKVLSLYSAQIMSLPWVERYGGLTFLAERYIEEGSPEIFPVSSNVSNSDCWQNGAYANLVPSASVKSIVYYEQIADINVVPSTRGKRSYQTYTTSLRLVSWLNIPLLGYPDTSICWRFIPGVKKELMKRPDIPVGGDLEKILVLAPEIKNISIDSSDNTKNNVFSKYSYGDERLFLYPYDFFSLTFDLTFTIDENCLEDIVLDNPINCIDYTK